MANLILGACGTPLEEFGDLSRRLDLADAGWEPGRIEFADRFAERFLREGWEPAEESPAGRFRRSRGAVAVIEFHLGRARDLVAEVVCRTSGAGSPMREVAVALNGREIARLRVGSAFQPHSFGIPASAQEVGTNLLAFRAGAPATGSGGASADEDLELEWRELRFLRPDASPLGGEPPSLEHDTLRLPAGSRVDRYVLLPQGWRLEFRRARAVGAQGAGGVEQAEELRLRVSLLRKGGGEQRLYDGPPPAARFQASGEPGLARLRWEAIAERAGAGSLIVEAPRLLRPPPPKSRVPTRASPASRPHVLLYLVDALRADRLGCYGHAAGLTPRLDAFARDSIVFLDTSAPSSWTKPSVASLLTGMWPGGHGANQSEDVLPEAVATLPEILRRQGYQTGAVVGNPAISERFGFERGFDDFDMKTKSFSVELNKMALAWLDARDERPFFLYLHTIDPHLPYDPPSPFRERFAARVADPGIGQLYRFRELLRAGRLDRRAGRQLLALYDAEVAFTDASFGRLLQALRKRGLYRDSLIVFVSDHGESFGEHGTWTHGRDLYRAVLQVPLILKLPGNGRAGERNAVPAQLTDLSPTLLARLGLPIPSDMQGRDLLAPARDPEVLPEEEPFAASLLDYHEYHGAAALTSRWKLIMPLRWAPGRGIELYDRKADPAERQNLADRYPVVTGYLASRLRARLQERREGRKTSLDAETRAALKALGYLGQ